ncbi:hypothetical protein LEP1GSC104_3660 [Leptospira interrogans str. UI 12621]|uniref:Uncharacterized protein n=1 Tax=Leptospira interrogans str. UI 12621 TaxID=1049937 RepID=A0A0F6HAG5_LEPIR|nr:hypothetical protein LEP1GSC104_3660 [Leptospira interrogans str. UI 12621]
MNPQFVDWSRKHGPVCPIFLTLNSCYLKACGNSHQTLILRTNLENVGTPTKL